MAKDAVKGGAELHSFEWGYRCGVPVYIGPGVVTDPPGTSFALGDDARWTETEAREVLDFLEGKYCPLAFSNHVDEFFPKEVNVIVARPMRPSSQGRKESVLGPGGSMEDDWRATVLVLEEEAASWVTVVQFADATPASFVLNERCPTQGSQQTHIMTNKLT